jgi:hypothetical protein
MSENSIPKTAKKPADRKPKQVVADLKADASEPGPFEFEHNGQTYVLPPASDAMPHLDGGDLMDALESENGEVKLAVQLLRLSDIDDDTMKALRSKKILDFSQTIGDWLKATQGDLGE